MTTAYLAADITAEEGMRFRAYPDPLSPLGKACAANGIDGVNYRTLPNFQRLSGSPWTIGVGCTGPDIGPATVWSEQQVTAGLNARISAFEAQLDQDIPWWRTLDDVRQDALVIMAFQMGVAGEMQFKNCLAAVRAHNWEVAKAQALDSTWARQTPARAGRVATQLATGVRQEPGAGGAS